MVADLGRALLLALAVVTAARLAWPPRAAGLAVAGAVVAVAAAAVVLHARGHRRSARAGLTAALAPLGLLPPARRRAWWLIAAPLLATALGLVAAALLVHLIAAPAPSGAGAARGASIAAAGLLGAVPLALAHAAIPEEVIFRGLGVLLPLGLLTTAATSPARRRATAIILAVVTTTGFAAAHAPYGARNIAVAAVLGAIYAALALTSRSVLPAIAAHAWYDAATFALPLLLAR